MLAIVLLLFLAFSNYLMKYTFNARHQVHMFTWNLICVFFGGVGNEKIFFFLQIV